MGRHYSAEDREQALATLAACGGNLHQAARETDIPRSTLLRWSKEMESYQAGMMDALANPARATKLMDELEGVLRKSIQRADERLDDAEHPPGLHHIASILRESHNAFLDHRDGRKGAEVNIDARQQSVRLSPVELREALAELRAARDAEEAAVHADDPATLGLPSGEWRTDRSDGDWGTS